MSKSAGPRLLLLAGAAALVVLGASAAVLVSRSAAADGSQTTGAVEADVDNVKLVDPAGKVVRWGELKGRPRAVFFGFTHCPVICPVTVWELNEAVERLGAAAKDIEIEFVTIDPERDTPARLKEYFGGFGDRIHPLTGAPESIASVAKSFQVTFRRIEGPNGAYAMDHTSTIFLVDRSGAIADVVAYDSPREIIEKRLLALLAPAGDPGR